MKRIFIIAILFALVVLGGLYFFRFHSSKAIFPVRGEYIELDGENIYTVVRGKGRTVLFLHGFPYHSETFTRIASTPIEGYRFITFDFPGAGLSSKSSAKKVTPETLAVMLKLLLDRIGVEKVDVVGHDLGGGVAIVFAALFPHMVDRVALIAPDSSAGTSAHIMSCIWRIPVLGELWASLRLDRQFIRHYLKKSWVVTDEAWRQIVERYARILNTPNGRNGFLALHRGRVDFDYTRFEEQFEATALILWGAQDHILSPALGTQLLQSLEHSDLEILEDVGHLPQEEIPEKIYQRLKLFLAKKIPPKKRFEEVILPADILLEKEVKPKRKKRKKTVSVKKKSVKKSAQLSMFAKESDGLENKAIVKGVSPTVVEDSQAEQAVLSPPDAEGLMPEQSLVQSDDKVKTGSEEPVKTVITPEAVLLDDSEKEEIR